MAIDLSRYLDLIKDAQTVRVRGRVTELTGLIIKASVPNVRVGELVLIKSRARGAVKAEVVGFQGDEVMLMPLGELYGIGPDSEVIPTGKPLSIKCGEALLGRVLNGIGEPMDGSPLPDEGLIDWSVDRDCPDPFTRQRIERPLPLGVRCIDGLLTVGEGQRVGLFAGSGVGKSTLMGQIARNTKADLCVVALIGERGREVREFIEDAMGEEGMKRSVLVCATSDQPSLVRLRAAYVATAIAEYFRERGGNVLFMLDTVTRLARAQREIGLAVGEPPARQGYPPSVFSMLPRILERTGNSQKGKCTAIYTCLVAGGDMEEPIADEVRGILDGHFILNRALGERNQWPAMDVLASLSRVMSGIVSKEHKKAAGKLRETLSTYEKQRDLILLGAYQYGTDPRTDYAIDKYDSIIDFLKQDTHSNSDFEDTVGQLVGLFDE
ncbi:type III secretion system ATPase SctN [Myxococcus sp. MISCRS1]|uniref:type III secretion system ATPase SctN n=1 Tax=Myxococcus TaxID=32 RepID=UPI001141A3E2|nr:MULTISPECIES: type III secretion system ATPase SctN [Myxococcus]BDT33325.1 type III secretion system ATPase SctN [Myxococcus sp. MH1]MBZ4397046.1 type III secretion system ATPase SctN [Myxococcus sp. AS-1-15]MBZ4408228.1 type III secretion system ATPase SctN [Myxococcus sp. XM-1-1-1]MCK8496173.1 type III secretion system ATPase SctN [Myxococcus fulvus]MCY0996658.1 type III secretion system ATPase SctN [Myxococcus sp. MISCRS1]